MENRLLYKVSGIDFSQKSLWSDIRQINNFIKINTTVGEVYINTNHIISIENGESESDK